ncbi:hypothetical protein NESM_000353200 [Novymonas esmeraldas]|uniref:Uncharacterized protein n=1 Tax=Novymonas esmeraldas TaxID=1808958 RepID=A0AAW0EJX2_9TRYP
MRGALVTSRALRRLLPSTDSEALLRSVWEDHHSPASWPFARRGTAASVQGAVCESGGVPQHRCDEVGCGGAVARTPCVPAPSHPLPDCVNSGAGELAWSSTTREQAYFTLEAARAHPMISFPEILTLWDRHVAVDGAPGARNGSPDFCPAEAALLNGKLDDHVLATFAAMEGVPPSIDTAPMSVAHALRSDLWVEGSPAVPVDLSAALVPQLPMCYTLLHFSAELGNLAYVRALRESSPSGFSLKWFSTPVEGNARCPDDLDGAADALVSAAHAPWQPALRVPRYLFEWVAEHCPDHRGMFLAHLAAAHGHAPYLGFLVGLLGARTVLEEQRCASPASPLNTWGLQRYLPRLSAVECAVAFHQTAVLEWVEVEHPHALEEMSSHTLMNAMVAAAMHGDDLTDTFSFFRTRSMDPLSLLDGSSVRGVGGAELEAAGLVRVVFAAAEAGNVGVLRWFDECLGRTDVRLLRNRQGATVLHHCARGGKFAAMGTLLARCTAVSRGDAAPQHQGDTGSPSSYWAPLDPAHVDVEDREGRTPAMWCVMGGGNRAREVEVLEELRNAGSDWPVRLHNGLSLFTIASRYHSRHTRLMRYLQRHCRTAHHP